MKNKVLLDLTGLHTCHKDRGIGRYNQGLLRGFNALHQKAKLELDMNFLTCGALDEASEIPQLRYQKISGANCNVMFLENFLRLDSVLGNSYQLYHASGMEGVLRNTPYVATCHDLIPLILKDTYLPKYNIPKRLFWYSYLQSLKFKARRIIAISEYVKSTLVDQFGIDSAKIDVVYHGLSDYWFSDPDEAKLKEEIKALKNEDFVLFIGGFDKRKNFDLMVRSLAMLEPSKRPVLVVAGSRDAIDKKRHEAIKELGDLDVRFLGYTDDNELLYLYRKAKALLFPSIEEGWGFPVVEAMASGTPVICADYGSMAESSGGLGDYCDVKDKLSLKNKIEEVLGRKETKAMKEKRIERARSLSWEECARKVELVYQRALS